MAPQTLRPDGKTFLAAVTTVAAVYVYFLIFAQFGLLRAVAGAWKDAGGVMPSILAGMALAGMAGSVIAAKVFSPGRGRALLAAGFMTCAAAATGVRSAESIAAFSIVALFTGLGVGVVTVALAGLLRPAAGDAKLGRITGLGTGLAYAFCNLPGIFDAGAGTQAWIAVGATATGFVASRALQPRFDAEAPRVGDYSRRGLASWIVIFVALVGLDSALFYFIQHTPELTKTMWTGAGRQGLNAMMHVAAAVLAGWALDRQGLGRAVAAAALALLVACVWLSGRHEGRAIGALLYIASVSAYSTALVFYPAHAGRPGVAAWIYAVAGWGGSAVGIGLVEGRGHFPGAVTAAAAVLLAISLMGRYFASRPPREMNENKPG